MTNNKETQIEEKSTRKLIVELTGYERNRRRRIIEVPASWSRDDMDRLSASDLDAGSGEWEDYGDGGIVLGEDIRLAGEAPDEAEVDLVICGEPPSSGIEYQLRLRRRLLHHISANLSSRVIAEAEDGLWKLAKATLSLPEGTEHEIEDLLKEFARRQAIEPQIKGDAAPVIRRRFAMWLAEGVRYEIDFAVGEDGVAIAQPIDVPPTMAEWLDEPVGTFFSAGGWVTHGEFVEADGGPEFLAAIRRGEIEGPNPQELKAAMQKTQAERELVEQLNAEAGLSQERAIEIVDEMQGH